MVVLLGCGHRRIAAEHIKGRSALLTIRRPQSIHAPAFQKSKPQISKSGAVRLNWDVEALRREVKWLEDGKFVADLTTYSRLFRECCQLQAVSEGRRIHEHLVRKGLLHSDELSLGNAVLSFYGKCGSLQESLQVFETLAKRDIVSWNTMISAYAAHGCGKSGLQMYSSIQWEGLTPNTITLITLLNAFSGASALEDGKHVHLLVYETGLEGHLTVGSALVNMYGRCESLENAIKVFSQIAHPNVVAWNVIIGAYAQRGNLQVCLQLFEQMQRMKVVPDKVTFLILIDACGCLGDLGKGKLIHTYILQHKLYIDIVVGNALINMYGKCKSVDDACQIFAEMHDKDVITWNSMLTANARQGFGETAFKIFWEMLEKGVYPTIITFTSLLNACASPSFFTRAKLIHDVILELGFGSDVAVLHGLVNMYSKSGNFEDALTVFNSMQGRNVVSWNTLIAAYTHHGHFQNAFQAFAHMQQQGFKPTNVSYVTLLTACSTLQVGQCLHAHIASSNLDCDTVLGNALVNMYARCGSVPDAFKVFEKLPNKDIVSWNSMIVAYGRQGYEKEALQLFRQLCQERVAANEVTLASILEVCAKLSDLEEGKRIHAQITESYFRTDNVVENALVDMYGKCGSMEDAHQIFMKMSRRDLVAWNAMIAACSKQEAIGALYFFGELQMEQVPPDHITIVGVLSACSHAGMVAEGYHYFLSVCQNYDIELTMEHYGCMVDLLGRAGWLEEADQLVASMPFQPSAALWMSLLRACKFNADVCRAKRIASHLLELDPQDSAAYILLADAYAAVGNEEEVP